MSCRGRRFGLVGSNVAHDPQVTLASAAEYADAVSVLSLTQRTLRIVAEPVVDRRADDSGVVPAVNGSVEERMARTIRDTAAAAVAGASMVRARGASFAWGCLVTFCRFSSPSTAASGASRDAREDGLDACIAGRAARHDDV